MTIFEWIVCERSNRWAAALRTTLGRERRTAAGTWSVHEVRNLRDFSARINEKPNNLALIEVSPTNFDEVLFWLADLMRRSRYTRAAALLDSTFAYGAERGGVTNCTLEEVADTLREAGAVEVVSSPRNLQQALRLGMRYASSHHRGINPQRHHDAGAAVNDLIEEWAWSLLPWQDAQRPLG